MKKYKVLLLGAIVLILSLGLFVTDGYAIGFDAAADCGLLGGTFNAASGICTLTGVPIAICPSGILDLYAIAYDPGTGLAIGWSPVCRPPVSGSGDWFIMSEYIEDSGRDDLLISYPADIYIHYAPETCTFGCNLSTGLYKNAVQSLNDFDEKVYARARVNISGAPIINSYRICFIADHLDTATIYQYTGYYWMAIGTTFYNGHACAYSSGTAQFVLVK